MKKVIYITLSLIFIITFIVGCSSQQNATVTFPFSFAEHIGKSYDKVLKEMKISEDEFVSERTGKYTTKDTVLFNDKEFSNYLMFDINDDTLFGGGYDYKSSDSDLEVALSLAKEISSELSKQYGTPVTYEGLPNKIENINSAEELYNANVPSFVEDWDAPSEIPCTIRLTLNVLPDNQYGINIEYRFSWKEDLKTWEALKESYR